MPLTKLLAVIGAAESGSEHPLATAVVNYVKGALGVKDISAKISDFRTVPGCGLEVKISNVDGTLSASRNSEEMKNFFNSLACISALR